MTERLKGISGSMFAGKTAELLRLVEREEIAKRKVQMFKPSIDVRWDTDKIKSHSGSEHDAIVVNNSLEILENLSEDVDLVAIDEIQFFDDKISLVIDEILDRDIRVLFAGLPLDFRGEPFGPVPVLLAKSDEVVKITAICTYTDNGEICGEEATRTQRILDGKPAAYTDPIVLVGADESYAARCPNHHIVPGKPERNLSNE